MSRSPQASRSPSEAENGGADIQSLRFLASPQAAELRSRVALAYQTSEPSVAWIASLRRDYPAEVIRTALAVGSQQAKARSHKFPGPLEPYFWTVPEALEQATSLAVATYKAARFGALGRAVLDLCCGVGGDALGLAQVAPVLAVDTSVVRCWCARQNLLQAGVRFPFEVIQADVTQRVWESSQPWAFHLDPSRRYGGHRTHRYQDLLPGPEFIAGLLKQTPDGVIKLSSAVDFESLPPGHLELLSERGVAVQALLWTGEMATGGENRRSATILSPRGNFQITGTPARVQELLTPQAWVYEVDPAVLRSGLVGELCQSTGTRTISSDGGYVTSSQRLDHPALTPFELIEDLGIWSESRMTAWLRGSGGGSGQIVEVKTRGGLELEVERLAKTWSKLARESCSVLIYRGHQGPTALIARRPGAAQSQ